MYLVRKTQVISFLSIYENSHLLSGKKDTVTQKVVQRHMLMKSLKELHAEYNSEVDGTISLSYRPFLRLRPFYITEPKKKDLLKEKYNCCYY